MNMARKIAGVLAFAFAAGAIAAGVRASRYYREFFQAFAATPAEGAIDLSKIGTTRMAFRSTYPMAHGVGLFLMLPEQPRGQAGEPAAECFGLDGEFRISDHSGSTVWTGPIEPRVGAPPPGDPESWNTVAPAIDLASVDVFSRGDYTLTVDVRSPAAKLAGVAQRLVGRYELCGLEKLPAMVYGAAAVVSGLLAGVFGLACLFGGQSRSVGL